MMLSIIRKFAKAIESLQKCPKRSRCPLSSESRSGDLTPEP